jgi:hypothetical protein
VGAGAAIAAAEQTAAQPTTPNEMRVLNCILIAVELGETVYVSGDRFFYGVHDVPAKTGSCIGHFALLYCPSYGWGYHSTWVMIIPCSNSTPPASHPLNWMTPPNRVVELDSLGYL